MAAALSLAASIIAVLGAAEGVAKALSKVRSIRKASDEVLALNNEVSNLQVILCDVQGYVRNIPESHISQEHLQHLLTFVDQAKEKLLQLDRLIHYDVLKPQSLPNNIKISKIEWLKAARTIDEFRRSLRDTRLNIVTHMMMINSTHQSRIALTIDKIHVVSSQIQAGQESSASDTHLRLDEQTRLFNDLVLGQTKIQGMLRLQQGANKTSQQSSIEGVPFNFTDSQSPNSIIQVRAYTLFNHRSPCTLHCQCVCHDTRTFKSPPKLQDALGILFIGYSGYPVRTFQRCTELSCVSKRAFRVYVHYVFPVWFLYRALTVAFNDLSNGTINAALHVRRIVPTGAEIFRLVCRGDVDGVKELFRSGLASPNDSDVAGCTVLSKAVGFRQFEVCDLLLKAGADPHLADFSDSISDYDKVWYTIFQASENSEDLEPLRNLFPKYKDFVEERGFSNIHKAVLKLGCRNLEEDIIAHRSMIDITDKDGSTALIWAARRGDILTLNLLVQANASFSSQNRFGSSALHYAAINSDLQSVQILIKASANTNNVDLHGHSALHYAGYFKSSVARGIVDCLVAAGAETETMNCYGATPLGTCARHNAVHTASALLDNGANIDALDNDGDSPLLQSIFSNADDATQLLLSRGATYTSWCSTGDSILHLAALSGGLRTLEILHNAKIQDVDPDAPNRQGQTALQVAQARASKPGGFVEKLQELLIEVHGRNAALQRAKTTATEAVSEHGNDPIRKAWSLGFNFQALLLYWVQSIRYIIMSVPGDTWRKSIWYSFLLTLIYCGFPFVCGVLGLSWVGRTLASAWYILSPGDFTET